MDGNRGFAPTQDASPPRGGRERPKAHEAGEHSPLPWRAEEVDSIRLGIRADGHGYVATLGIYGANPDWEPTQRTNAAFIVKACNLHRELVAACRAALVQAEGCWREHYGEDPEAAECPTPEHIALLRAAIAKAEAQ